MSVFNNMKSIKDKVKLILSNRVDSRDSDDLLIALFWFYESQKDIKNMSAEDFLRNLSLGKYANTESIRRDRQKLQEQNEALRGKSYKARKKESKEVQQNIHDL